MTLLACMAMDGRRIDPFSCVQEQIESRCFCPKAAIALSEVSTGTPDPRLRHQMPVLSARAQAMYRKPPEQRYAGPALRVHNKEVADASSPVVEPHTPEAMKPEEGVSPPVEPMQAPTPGSPAGSDIREEVIAQAPRVCRIEGCGKELRSDNRSGLCARHMLEARSLRGSRVLGVPRIVFPSSTQPHVAKPKETVVPIKPVEAHPLAQVVDSPLKVGEPVAPAGIPLRDPTSLPHEYLIACVKEARRRLAALDEHFTFITAKEA